MDTRAYIIESITRVRQSTLNAVKGLSPEQLRWTPGPAANHIAFLLYHIFRTEDSYLYRWIQPGKQLWEVEGWDQRWRLPTREARPWTVQEARAFEAPLDELLAYGAAVRSNGLRILQNLDLSRLDEHPNPNRPESTVAQFVQNLVTHETHHEGSIEYLIGLHKSLP